ncbi:hypothetical protein LTR53_014378, partial [Teratosphaeriaceae sp. CCFEE 6253]
MQSIFRLPWATDQLAPKMQAAKASAENTRASPVLDLSVLDKRKRQQTDSPEPYSAVWMPPVKKARGEGHSPHVAAHPLAKPKLAVAGGLSHQQSPHLAQSHAIPMSHANDDSQSHLYRQASLDAHGTAKTASYLPPQPAAKCTAEEVTPPATRPSTQLTALDMTPLRQTIENEFNMQILMKHNELRLIEQELAKCQVALEQLRRCELRPYPGTQQLSASLSDGVGSSVAPPSGYTRPPYAPPYGVTDGPYTSHYRQWLLHDPYFEPAPTQVAPATNTPASGDSRHTRHASTARKPVQKSFTMPNSSVNLPMSLPNYPLPSRKNKIAVVKRSTDGQLVKL